MLRPPRLFRKPSTAQVAHLSFSATLHCPLLPNCRSRDLHTDTSMYECSTRASSASLKRLQRCETVAPTVDVECRAAAWAVTNGKTGEMMCGKAAYSLREIASLTKIMTCLLSVQLLRVLEGLTLESLVSVSERAGSMCGTSARLRPGDRLRIKDLLYALMLPSGNDAAQCLAEVFGLQLVMRAGGDPTSRVDKYFVREMNDFAQSLGLTRTFFRNPHGMSTNKNLSTARDVNSLSSIAMRNSTFRMVVNCARYNTTIRDAAGFTRSVVWENTNRLLSKGYEGVKTGSTGAAGPCLCACYNTGQVRIVVTVLGAATMEERWNDVPLLTKYAMELLRRDPPQDLGSTVHVPRV